MATTMSPSPVIAMSRPLSGRGPPLTVPGEGYMGTPGRGSPSRMDTSCSTSPSTAVDFDRAGASLIQRDEQCLDQFREVDAVWKHPGSRGILYVGTKRTAEDGAVLRQLGITRIVNCMGGCPNFFAHQPHMEYRNFEVAEWIRAFSAKGHAGLLDLFMPLLNWVGMQLAQGRNVLIHCLAGAHRAGSTSVAFVMLAEGLDFQSGYRQVKQKRPVVHPISHLSTMLTHWEAALKMVSIPPWASGHTFKVDGAVDGGACAPLEETCVIQ
mmetsp:Transcript_27218/g.65544  ORF Transcript_27218/g.65544 Transcript_27218/m.65544 type:complete len:267 (+) Transcript_27218:37-837(+)